MTQSKAETSKALSASLTLTTSEKDDHRVLYVLVLLEPGRIQQLLGPAVSRQRAARSLRAWKGGVGASLPMACSLSHLFLRIPGAARAARKRGRPSLLSTSGDGCQGQGCVFSGWPRVPLTQCEGDGCCQRLLGVAVNRLPERQVKTQLQGTRQSPDPGKLVFWPGCHGDRQAAAVRDEGPAASPTSRILRQP